MAEGSYPSLKDRIKRARSETPCSSSVSDSSSGRSGQYKMWSNINMVKAMTLVEQGASVRCAAEKCGVPRSTLHDRVSGKIQQGTKPGPDPYLTMEEEEELASFLVKCGKIGYPHTQKQVLSLVQQILEHKGITVSVTSGWWERFSSRRNLTLRTAVPLTYVRAMATDEDTLNKYYDLLEETLRANDLLDKPACIYNCDETGLPLSPKSPKVVSEVGAKDPCCITGNTKSQITVLACANATGRAVPPFVIFDRKTLNPKLTCGEVPGSLYGLSPKGWIDRALFNDWFFDHFLTNIPSARPVLLLMDGHSSHYCPEVIRAAAAEKVVLFTLPPHTTHLTQPLDKGCFAPLKAEWRKRCQEFFAKNPGQVISRYDFNDIFREVWMHGMSMQNIISAFKTTGVYPFSRKVIQKVASTKFLSFEPKSLPSKSGLAYIPLYSPARPCIPQDKDQHNSDPLESHSSSEEEPYSDSSVSRCLYMPTQRPTVLNKFLKVPLPPNKQPTKREKSSGRVLTSAECIRVMEEKEKEKELKARQKEQRQRAREEKAKQKALISRTKGKRTTTETRCKQIKRTKRRESLSESDGAVSEGYRDLHPDHQETMRKADRILKALRRKPTASLVSSPEVVHLKRQTKERSNGAAEKQVVMRSSCSSDTLSDLSIDINLQILTLEDDEAKGDPASMSDVQGSYNSNGKPRSRQKKVKSKKADVLPRKCPAKGAVGKVKQREDRKKSDKAPQTLAAEPRVTRSSVRKTAHASTCEEPDCVDRGRRGGACSRKEVQGQSLSQVTVKGSCSSRSIGKHQMDKGGPSKSTSSVMKKTDVFVDLTKPKSVRKGDGSDTSSRTAIGNKEQLGNSLTLWKKSLTLTNEDRRQLLSGGWLTANHISAAHHLLKRAFPKQNGLCDTSYLPEKFMWPSSKDAFVQIVYVSGNHWACLSNVLCERENIVDLYDSMPSDVSSTIKEQAATILHCQAPSFTVRVVNVQRQDGGDSCGLFAIAMAYDLCNRQDPFVSTYNESRLRPHLQRCFQQEKISQFPGGNPSKRRKKRILHEVSVDVFCTCRYPDIDITTHLGNMACCSVCDEWFHEECEDIADNVFTEAVDWVCSDCSK